MFIDINSYKDTKSEKSNALKRKIYFLLFAKQDELFLCV